MEARTSNRNFDTAANHSLACGDKIFVRILNGRCTVLELSLQCVSSMTDLISEIREKLRGKRGLVTLYLRNLSRGWSLQRPLMLYAPASAPRKMQMPWETH